MGVDGKVSDVEKAKGKETLFSKPEEQEISCLALEVEF